MSFEIIPQAPRYEMNQRGVVPNPAISLSGNCLSTAPNNDIAHRRGQENHNSRTCSGYFTEKLQAKRAPCLSSSARAHAQ